MYILKLESVLKDYLWGGDRLIKKYGFKSDKEIAAEAWVLSCHKDGPSRVSNGDLAGRELRDVLTEKELGENCKKFDKFPILTKLIDAKDNLSLQVHPSDETADKEKGEEGKTESWYIADCDEGAELIYGFKEDISREDFIESVNNGSFIDKVNRVKVKKGECYHIEAGTLHAICKGIFLVEVQQNSNTTFRVYDYDRVGADGKKRELHTEKALNVINYKKQESVKFFSEENTSSYSKRLLSKCEFYEFFEVKTHCEYAGIADEKSFVSFVCIEGSGEIKCSENSVSLKAGDCVFVPANTGKFEISGEMTLLETRVP